MRSLPFKCSLKFDDPEVITLALNTLGSFDFSGIDGSFPSVASADHP